ncbi:MAG: universal stress protein, partial [Planctomycetales bacterium]|nr:universal stress protein [Planctomycetales bacterium]
MRILLALDGSSESLQAAHFLAQLPLPEKSHVSVVSVLVDTQFDLVESSAGVQLREAEREASVQHYQAVQETLSQAGLSSEHILKEGHPNHWLLRLGKELDIDLMVLGARGHSLFARALLGSTSDYIANHARCPVLIVRPTRPQTSETAPFRVLLAYDGSAGSKAAAEQMFSLAWDATTEVQITTLLERPN